MNYRHVYMCIIAHAKKETELGLRPINHRDKKNFPNQHFEFHHILPRSLFPLWAKRKSNIVALTFREHGFCHRLLAHIYESESMDRALYMMMNRGTILSSREYERLRTRYVESQHEFAKTHLALYGVKTRFVKGQTPWNKGLLTPDDVKKRVSDGTKRAMSKIDMGAKMQAWIATLAEEENLERKRKAGLHRKLYGDENPMANPIHRETVKQKRNEAAALYKEYKKNGGELMWNEWNKLHAQGLV